MVKRVPKISSLSGRRITTKILKDKMLRTQSFFCKLFSESSSDVGTCNAACCPAAKACWGNKLTEKCVAISMYVGFCHLVKSRLQIAMATPRPGVTFL